VTQIHLPDIGPHDPFEPAPGVRVVPVRTPTLPPATATNCVIAGLDELVIIDPASPYADEQERLRGLVESIERPVQAIWLTHHHPDHIGGVAALKAALDVPVLAHPAAAGELPAGTVDEPLYDGDRVDLGGVELEVLHTPGHCRGHLAFREPNSRLLVAGDLVAGQGTVVIDPPDGDMADYLATLGRLVRDGVGTLIPAHGPLIAVGEERLLGLIAHRMAREEQALAGLQAGARRPLDLVPGVYPEVPIFFHPIAARQVLAHLLKLEAEGRVVRSGEAFSLR
jgi:endoribonuclease LACTB2